MFDISQTDGTPLPELPTKSVGERGQDMLDRLLRFAESRGITVQFVDKCKLNGAAGKSKGTEIEIRTSETDVTIRAATLAHEIAHSLLHWRQMATRSRPATARRSTSNSASWRQRPQCTRFARTGIQSPSDFYMAAYKVTPAMLLEAARKR